MQESSVEFLKNYQKSLFSGENDTPIQKAEIQRKCLVQLFDFSKQTLDEHSTNYLLEKNLHKYCRLVESDKTRNDRVKNALEKANIKGPVNLKSNLENIDLKSILTSLPCYSTNAFSCAQSECVNEGDFNEFMHVLRKGLPSQSQAAPALTKNKRSSHTAPLKPTPSSDFKTAAEELNLQNLKKGQKRKLGLRRNVNSKFVPPLLTKSDSMESASKSEEWPGPEVDERLKSIDPKMVELIKHEIMDIGTSVQWDDIAGLEFAKTAIQEAVVWPMLRPDIFTGLRRPPKGILLFGPPGTGKTLIGKCVASQSKSTFFSISASSLTSKWVGEGEKMVRALFAVARVHQPSVVFIDEVDSLLTQRSETEHESSRRIKTEFLVQLDGAGTDSEEQLLVIGATNRPQELDEAARRRFTKRLYIPLPEFEARQQLLRRLIEKESNRLSERDFAEVATLADGYSGADIRNLCSEAALGPVRDIDLGMIEQIKADDVRALEMDDFTKAFKRVRSSVAPRDLEQYFNWDKTYGSGL